MRERTGEAIDHLQTDSVMAELIDTHGEVHLEPADDPFERLVASIIRQQISMDAASAIQRRLERTVDITPSTLLEVDRGALEGAGLSRQKISTLRNVATAFEEQAYDRAHFEGLDDDEVIDELTAIHGVGPWTAKMFLIFCLARPDVFPIEDLGIRNGITTLYDTSSNREEMHQLAERWRPYRTYASCYIWRGMD